MDNKAILITTRYYPMSDTWTNLPLSSQDELDFANPSFLDFNEEDTTKKVFSDKPSIKFMNVGRYNIYVAPCLIIEENELPKALYLEKLLRAIWEEDSNLNSLEEDLYLVAHDYDFNWTSDETERDVAIVEKRHVKGDDRKTPLLSNLVENRHVYMFQHGDDKKLGWFINTNKWAATDPEKMVSEADCEKLMDIINEGERLLRFFGVFSNNPNYRYPKVNNNE